MLCVIEFSIHVIKISLNSIEIKKKTTKKCNFNLCLCNRKSSQNDFQYLYTSHHCSINNFFLLSLACFKNP